MSAHGDQPSVDELEMPYCVSPGARNDTVTAGALGEMDRLARGDGTLGRAIGRGERVANARAGPTGGRKAPPCRVWPPAVLYRFGEPASRPKGQTAMQTPHTPPSPSCLSVSRSHAFTS